MNKSVWYLWIYYQTRTAHYHLDWYIQNKKMYFQVAECTNDGHQACYTEVFRKETGDKSYKKVKTDVLNFTLNNFKSILQTNFETI